MQNGVQADTIPRIVGHPILGLGSYSHICRNVCIKIKLAT